MTLTSRLIAITGYNISNSPFLIVSLYFVVNKRKRQLANRGMFLSCFAKAHVKQQKKKTLEHLIKGNFTADNSEDEGCKFIEVCCDTKNSFHYYLLVIVKVIVLFKSFHMKR